MRASWKSKPPPKPTMPRTGSPPSSSEVATARTDDGATPYIEGEPAAAPLSSMTRRSRITATPTGRTAESPAALLATLRRVTTPKPDATEEAVHVRRDDSLRQGVGQLFDVVITNPPFKETADPAAHAHLDLPRTGKAELLFAALALQSLRSGGAAALLLPDNFLWARTRAHTALRKAFVEGCALRAVATIPAAAFHPHTAAKTCAVIFRKGGATGTVAFYKIADHEGGLSAAASHFAVGATREGAAGGFTAATATAADIRARGYSLSPDTYRRQESERDELHELQPPHVIARHIKEELLAALAIFDELERDLTPAEGLP
jgi:type I restriction-modification system DNA methylase subunit